MVQASDRDQGTDGANLLPLRWVVILGLSATVGVMIGTAEGLSYGIFASLFTTGTAHSVLK